MNIRTCSEILTKGYLSFIKSKGWLFENVIPRSVLDNLMMSNLLAARNRAHAKQKKLEAAAAKKE